MPPLRSCVRLSSTRRPDQRGSRVGAYRRCGARSQSQERAAAGDQFSRKRTRPLDRARSTRQSYPDDLFTEVARGQTHGRASDLHRLRRRPARDEDERHAHQRDVRLASHAERVARRRSDGRVEVPRMLAKAQGGGLRSVSGATSAAPRQRAKAALVCAARFGITVDRPPFSPARQRSLAPPPGHHPTRAPPPDVRGTRADYGERGVDLGRMRFTIPASAPRTGRKRPLPGRRIGCLPSYAVADISTSAVLNSSTWGRFE